MQIGLSRMALTGALRSILVGTPPGEADSTHGQVLDLWANGEQGALYYFTEDFAGLYQDAAGTTPVTAVGQPVGLMLDRRFGLATGEDIFPSEITHTTNGSLVVEAVGNRQFYFPGGGQGYLFVATGLFSSTDSAYELEWEFIPDAGAMYGVRDDSLLQSSPYYTGRYRHIQRPRHVNRIQFYAVTGTAGTLVIHSIRELPGNHASQATTTARPTLQRDANGKLYLAFDGVDDFLSTQSFAWGDTYYAGLSGCTREASVSTSYAWRHAAVGTQGFLAVSTRGGEIRAYVPTNASSAPPVTVPDTAVAVRCAQWVGQDSLVSYSNGTVGSTAIPTGALNSEGVSSIGASNPLGNPCKFNFYSALKVAGAPSSAQRMAVDSFLASRAGITLPEGVPA